MGIDTDLREESVRARIRLFEAEAEAIEYKNRRTAREEAVDLAVCDEVHIFPFYGPVDNSTVPKAISIMDMWSRKDPGCDITIIFTSNGGNVVDGLALYDFIQELKRRGHTVVTKCRGAAISMAAVIMQAGSRRVMEPNSFLLIHELASTYTEKTRLSLSEQETEKRINDKFQSTLYDILTAQSTLTRRQMQARADRDWLVSASEAVEFGLADEVEQY